MLPAERQPANPWYLQREGETGLTGSGVPAAYATRVEPAWQCLPQAPQLCAIANGSRAARICIGSDNPDNLYENAVLDGRREYVVHGVRGTVAYLGLGTQSGAYGAKGGLATVDYAEAETLRYDDAARTRFTLVLSATRPADATNWLRLVQDPPEAMFIVRQTFGRRSEEEAASLSIALRGDGGGSGGGTPLTPKRLDDGLQSASVLVAGASAMFAKWAYGFQAHANTLPLFDQQTSDRAGGDPNIRYYHSYWRLPAGMALRIRVRPPPCRCWNFQLNSASRRTSNLAPPRRATPRHTATRALFALHHGLTPPRTLLSQTTGWRASTTGTSPYTPTAAWRDPTRPTLRASR